MEGVCVSHPVDRKGARERESKVRANSGSTEHEGREVGVSCVRRCIGKACIVCLVKGLWTLHPRMRARQPCDDVYSVTPYSLSVILWIPCGLG
jgi:hypothetical protein